MFLVLVVVTERQQLMWPAEQHRMLIRGRLLAVHRLLRLVYLLVPIPFQLLMLMLVPLLQR